MCAQTPHAADLRRPGRSGAFDAAMDGLRQAVAGGKPDPICAAYLKLRRTARGMSPRALLTSADRAIGPGSAETVLAAFSARRCFMCNGGAVPCETCDGTGQREGHVCPQCDGLGVEPCAFCQAAAWCDGEQTPAELARGVLRRRIAAVAEDVKRFQHLSPARVLASADTPARRRRLAAWLMRLKGRLGYVASAGNGDGADARVALGGLGERIDAMLEALRPADVPATPAED